MSSSNKYLKQLVAVVLFCFCVGLVIIPKLGATFTQMPMYMVIPFGVPFIFFGVLGAIHIVIRVGVRFLIVDGTAGGVREE